MVPDMVYLPRRRLVPPPSITNCNITAIRSDTHHQVSVQVPVDYRMVAVRAAFLRTLDNADISSVELRYQDGTQVPDDATVSQLGRERLQNLVIVPIAREHLDGPHQLYISAVRTDTNESISVYVDQSATVGDLKLKMAQVVGQRSIDNIMLIYAGNSLENDTAVNSLSIAHESRLLLLITGPQRETVIDDVMFQVKVDSSDRTFPVRAR